MNHEHQLKWEIPANQYLYYEIRSPRLYCIFMTFFFVFNVELSTALGQNSTNVSITYIYHNLRCACNAGGIFGPLFTTNASTNLNSYYYSGSSSTSDATFGDFASCLCSQSGIMLIQSNILYLTGSAYGAGTASFGGNASDTYGSGGLGRSIFTTYLTLNVSSSFILQVSTAVGVPYPSTPDGNGENLEANIVRFEGMGQSNQFGNDYLTNGPVETSPSSGQISGILQPGNYSFNYEAEGNVSLGAGLTRFAYYWASLSYSLCIYPTPSGGGSGSGGGGSGGTANGAANPTLGINYDGANIILSWPMEYPNYLLTSNTNLCSSNWNVVT